MNAPLVRRSPAHRAVVVGSLDLTPRMRRVTVRADSMIDADLRPAQDVELLLRQESGRRVKRRYTIRTARPELGELDLDVLLHGSGPGSRWGADAQPGDEVEFQGPRGKLELRPAPFHLLVGDESALPAIAAIAEALPDGEASTAVVEVRSAEDELPVRGDVRWVHRGSTDAGGSELLDAAVRAAIGSTGGGRADAPQAGAPRADGPGADGLPAGARAYLMGESRAMVALRAVVESLGVEHDAIFVKGYWNIGRPDRLAGRAPA